MILLHYTTLELHTKATSPTRAVDAIANAANSGLQGGGGVDGAIHRGRAGYITAEGRRIGGCPTGGAVVTSGGTLAERYVIHAVESASGRAASTTSRRCCAWPTPTKASAARRG